MIKLKQFLAMLLVVFSTIVYAQCTINAGSNQTICGTTATLAGSISGGSTGTPTWTLVSKPGGATDPVIGNMDCYSNGWNNVKATSVGAVKSYTVGSTTFTATYTLNSGSAQFYPNYTPGGIFGTMALDMAGVRNGIMTTTFSTPIFSMDLGWDDFDWSEITSFQFYDQSNSLIPTTVLQTALVFSGTQTTISYPTNGTIKVVATNSGNTSGSDTQIRFNFPGTIGISKIVATATNSQQGDNDMFLVGGCVAGVCFNDPVINGTGPATKVGITLLKRAGASPSQADNWPMVRKSGHIALESNTQGFVVTRMTTAQLNAIKTANNAVEGMMSYDTDAKCLKIFDGTDWKCFNNPSCP